MKKNRVNRICRCMHVYRYIGEFTSYSSTQRADDYYVNKANIDAFDSLSFNGLSETFPSFDNHL